MKLLCCCTVKHIADHVGVDDIGVSVQVLVWPRFARVVVRFVHGEVEGDLVVRVIGIVHAPQPAVPFALLVGHVRNVELLVVFHRQRAPACSRVLPLL